MGALGVSLGPMSASQRVFLGLGPEPDTAVGIVREAQSAFDGAGPVQVYAPDDLHLTLAFLGELDAADVARVRALAEDEFRGLLAPELVVLGAAGAFPSIEEPRAVWRPVAEAAGTDGRLHALRNRAVQVGLATGWRPRAADRERPFRPHVTVARPGGAGALGNVLAGRLGRDRSWLAHEVLLYRSLPAEERSATGARYVVLDRWNLGVRPD